MAEHDEPPIEAYRQLIEAYREFTHQIMLRFDRSTRSFEAAIRKSHEAHQQNLLAHREESRKYFEALDARAEADARRTDELIAESRVQRQALLHILDRLDNGGAAPAT